MERDKRERGKELWCKTYLQEHVKSGASWPWNMQGAALIKKEDPDFSACKDIARYALEPIIAIGETSVTWQMSSRFMLLPNRSLR